MILIVGRHGRVCFKYYDGVNGTLRAVSPPLSVIIPQVAFLLISLFLQKKIFLLCTLCDEIFLLVNNQEFVLLHNDVRNVQS